MDYVDWCDHVLSTLVEKANTDLTARSFGIYTEQIMSLFNEQNSQAVNNDSFQSSLTYALMDFEAIGLLESDRQRVWKIRKIARDYLLDKVSNWEAICNTSLEEEHAQLLRTVQKLGLKSEDNWVSIDFVSSEELQKELGWKDGFSRLNVLATELDREGLVKLYGWIGGFKLRSTFLGLVWNTRRDFTIESRQIDDLVTEWETTNVDFKRELYLDTADQKAEFVKDVLSLLNTYRLNKRG